MFITLNRYVLLFEDKQNPPLVDWWDYDKYNKRFSFNQTHRVLWSLDDKPVVDGGDNTIVVITNKKGLTVAEAKPLIEAFESENASIIRTIQFTEERRKEADRKFKDLTGLLKTLLQHEGTPFNSADWNTAVDGRLFPFLVFEDRTLPIGQRRGTYKSGYVCPKCGGWDVIMDKEILNSSSRDSASWLQDWHCNSCSDTWQYVKVWAD